MKGRDPSTGNAEESPTGTAHSPHDQHDDRAGNNKASRYPEGHLEGPLRPQRWGRTGEYGQWGFCVRSAREGLIENGRIAEPVRLATLRGQRPHRSSCRSTWSVRTWFFPRNLRKGRPGIAVSDAQPDASGPGESPAKWSSASMFSFIRKRLGTQDHRLSDALGRLHDAGSIPT